jgi:phosphatidylinositol alpha-1,6-mannosyltransferase
MVGSFPRPIGGVSNVCFHLCQELSKKNVIINFVDTNFNTDKTVPQGVKIHMVKPFSLRIIKCLLFHPLLILNCLTRFVILVKTLRILSDISSIIGIVNEILEINKKEHIDIIHTHHAYPRSFASLIVGKYLKLPVVVTVYCSEFTEEPFTQKYLKLVKYITFKADKVIAISEFTKRQAIEKEGQRDIEVIPCGVDSKKFNPRYNTTELAKKYSITGNTIVLFVGWLIARKGPGILLRAIPLIKDKRNVRFLFIGPDHGLKDKLSQMIEDYHLRDDVILLGEVSDEELVRFYALADIFIFPTVAETEGFGIVAAEAMASETPVIGSKIAAIPEVVVDGKTGILVEPNDPVELAKAIDKLLKDEILRKEMGKEGRKWVKSKFNWEKISEEVIEVYRSCI